MNAAIIDLKEWMPVVEMTAASFRQPYQFDDLVSEGLTALCEASEKFDPSVGASFMTYAAYRIKGQMRDYLRQWLGKGRGRPTGRNKRVRDIKVYSIDRKVSGKPEDEGDLTIADTIGGDGATDKYMEFEEVATAMDRCLTETEREYLRLRFEEGLYFKEIGAYLGVSEAVACHACKRAILKLREELGVT